MSGDIVSRWNPVDESVVLPENADPDDYLTTLNFGLRHAAGDVTVDDYEADPNFVMRYDGRIFAGIDPSTAETQKASIAMNVCGGSLSFNDLADIETLSVVNGAVLSGNALYKVDAFTNNGTLAPGNSIGRIYIQGDYIEGADARLALEFDGSGQTDQIVIEGTALREDGTKALFIADVAPAKSYYGSSLTVNFSSAVFASDLSSMRSSSSLKHSSLALSSSKSSASYFIMSSAYCLYLA